MSKLSRLNKAMKMWKKQMKKLVPGGVPPDIESMAEDVFKGLDSGDISPSELVKMTKNLDAKIREEVKHNAGKTKKGTK